MEREIAEIEKITSKRDKKRNDEKRIQYWFLTILSILRDTVQE